MNEAGHVVVTGGSGFVGGYLVRHLLDRGVGRITILDRVTPEIVDSRVVHVPGDIADGISWSPPTPVEAVYHLAAACREPGFTMEQYFRDNYEGTIALSKWLESAKVRNVIFTSTMMVYGAGDSRMTEESPTRPDTDYGRSKILAEWVLRAWRQSDESRRLRIVRPAVIFGKGERNNFTKLHRALQGRRFFFVGRDSTVKSCIYVKDFVRFISWLERDTGAWDLYNAALPEPTTIRAVCDAMSRAYGWQRSIPTVPYCLALLAAWPFEAIEATGLVQSGIHRRRIQKLYYSTHIGADRLQRSGFVFDYSLGAAIADWKRDCLDGPLA